MISLQNVEGITDDGHDLDMAKKENKKNKKQTK